MYLVDGLPVSLQVVPDSVEVIVDEGLNVLVCEIDLTTVRVADVEGDIAHLVVNKHQLSY